MAFLGTPCNACQQKLEITPTGLSFRIKMNSNPTALCVNEAVRQQADLDAHWTVAVTWPVQAEWNRGVRLTAL